MAAACNGDSPTSPPLEPLYGACDVQPTYASEVALNRWPSFPLAYFFYDETFPSEFLDDYRSDHAGDGTRRPRTSSGRSWRSPIGKMRNS